jgi:hypothetical protein
MKKGSMDNILSLSKTIGKQKANNNLIDCLTETVLLIEKELKKSLTEDEIANVVEYTLKESMK